LKRGSSSLREAYHNGSNIEGREGMSLCALFAGMALANSKLGTVHGFAGVIGGMYEEAPHGAICAALLPVIMKHNIDRLSELLAANSINQKQKESLHKYEETARYITSHSPTHHGSPSLGCNISRGSHIITSHSKLFSAYVSPMH